MAFSFNPINGLLDTNTFPTNPGSETEARQQFMTLFNQLKEYINEMQAYKLTADNGVTKTFINDMNLAIESGIYNFATGTLNNPMPGEMLGILEVYKRTGDYIYQRAWGHISDGSVVIAIRRSQDRGTTWDAWRIDASLKGSSGYIKFSSGLIIQWGLSTVTITANTNTAQSITFPISFPSAAVYASVEPATNAPKDYESSYSALGQSGMTIYTNGNSSTSLSNRWIALGY